MQVSLQAERLARQAELRRRDLQLLRAERQRRLCEDIISTQRRIIEGLRCVWENWWNFKRCFTEFFLDSFLITLTILFLITLRRIRLENFNRKLLTIIGNYKTPSIFNVGNLRFFWFDLKVEMLKLIDFWNLKILFILILQLIIKAF